MKLREQEKEQQEEREESGGQELVMASVYGASTLGEGGNTGRQADRLGRRVKVSWVGGERERGGGRMVRRGTGWTRCRCEAS